MYGLLYIRATRGCRRQSPAPGSRTFLSLQHLCRRREGGSVRPPSHPTPPAAAAEPQRRPQRTNRVKKAPFYKICLRTKRNKETKQQQQQKKKKKRKKSQTRLPLYSRYSILSLRRLTKATVPNMEGERGTARRSAALPLG